MSQPPFQSSAQLQACLESLFDHLRQNERGMRALKQSGLVIGLQYTDPAVRVVVDARPQPALVYYQGAGPVPVLDIELPAETFHRILLDELTLTKALGQKKLIVKGPVMKAMLLAELFRQGRAVYRQILNQHGNF